MKMLSEFYTFHFILLHLTIRSHDFEKYAYVLSCKFQLILIRVPQSSSKTGILLRQKKFPESYDIVANHKAA
jgi:hypothetical protein